MYIHRLSDPIEPSKKVRGERVGKRNDIRRHLFLDWPLDRPLIKVTKAKVD